MTRSRAVLAVLALLLATSLMVCPSTALGQNGKPVPDRGNTTYDEAPHLINGVEIRSLLAESYPRALRDSRIGGKVTLWMYVNAAGGVEQVTIQKASVHQAFNNAARKIGYEMWFRPALRETKPVSVWILQQVVFDPLSF